MLSDLRIRLRAMFRPEAMDAELNEELRFHFDNQVEKNISAGMTRNQATREAQILFGGPTQVKEDCRDARGMTLLETLHQDIRYSLRAMRRSPGFFSIAAVTLALGIGASTAVFSLVYAVLFKPLPYPNAARDVMLWRSPPIHGVFSGADNQPWAPAELNGLSRSTTVFENLSGFEKDTFNLTGSGTPEMLEGVRTTPGFFPALGVSPLLGRAFDESEHPPGSDHVVVLSYGLWRARFAADPGIAGKIVHLNGLPYTVIGVMPASFTFPNQEGIPAILDMPQVTELWVPTAVPPAIQGDSVFGVIAHLKPGVGPAQVDQDLHAFEQKFEQQFPRSKGAGVNAVALRKQTVQDTRRPLLLLLGAVSVVLLIACANVAGLTLNRSLGRSRELTLRGALGARRNRLVRQLMTESLLLAFTAGAMGILLGQTILVLVRQFGPAGIYHLREAALDWRVAAYALAVTLFTGLLFGLVPAIGATRINMVQALKEGGQRSGGSSTAPRIRNALMIGQIALALILVIAAGLLGRTFYSVLHADAGFDAAHVVTFELSLPGTKYSDTKRMQQTYQQILRKLQSMADVQSAGFASVVPMAGGPDATILRIPGHPETPGAVPLFANYEFVSPGYFATIGAPLLRGRDLSDSDTTANMPVTVITSAMARKYFPGEDPIGKQVGPYSKRYDLRTIVGVVGDIKHESLKESPESEMFVPYTQNDWPSMQVMQFAVRFRGSAADAESIRAAVNAVDPDLPVAKLATLNDLVDNSMTAERFSMLVVAAFGCMALILASIGMYGVISYSVMQRTPEIGVRIALGAARRQIFVMILMQAGRLAAVGIGAGLIGALVLTRLMTRFLYGVHPADPFTFVAVCLLLIAVTLMACLVPARRALRVDPMVALRCE